jgi:hypothetical protein
MTQVDEEMWMVIHIGLAIIYGQAAVSAVAVIVIIVEMAFS